MLYIVMKKLSARAERLSYILNSVIYDMRSARADNFFNTT